MFKIVFWRQVSHNFWAKKGLDAVTVLAYTSLVGLVPLLAVMLSIFSMTAQFELFEASVMEKVVHHLLPTATPMVESYLLEFSKQASQLTGVGIVITLMTALILLSTIDQKINSMWGEHQQRKWWVSLLHYLGISLLGPLLLGGSFVLSSYLLALPFINELPSNTSLLTLAPVAVSLLGFWVLYRFVPSEKVSWKAAFVGALFAAIQLALLKLGFALYVKWFPSYSLIYGAFAVIPLFLLWLYLLWFVLIFNASVVYQLNQCENGSKV